MTVRVATAMDIPAILAMSLKFAELSPYSQFTTESKLLSLIDGMIKDPNCLVLVNDDNAFLAATIHPFLFGEAKQATELGWWVEPEVRKTGVGKELLENFEKWAWFNGCKVISMGGISDDTDALYKAKGYALADRIYIKEV